MTASKKSTSSSAKEVNGAAWAVLRSVQCQINLALS
jgi:hypothetical protein